MLISERLGTGTGGTGVRSHFVISGDLSRFSVGLLQRGLSGLHVNVSLLPSCQPTIDKKFAYSRVGGAVGPSRYATLYDAPAMVT